MDGNVLLSDELKVRALKKMSHSLDNNTICRLNSFLFGRGLF